MSWNSSVHQPVHSAVQMSLETHRNLRFRGNILLVLCITQTLFCPERSGVKVNEFLYQWCIITEWSVQWKCWQCFLMVWLWCCQLYSNIRAWVFRNVWRCMLHLGWNYTVHNLLTRRDTYCGIHSTSLGYWRQRADEKLGDPPPRHGWQVSAMASFCHRNLD